MKLQRLGRRLEDLLGWMAAAVLTAGAVIYAIKLDEDRKRPQEDADPSAVRGEVLAVQQARAKEPGRGRRAQAPVHIPWRGWKDILARSYQAILNDRVMALAAGVVFYSLVALFPAVAAAVSLYTLFSNPTTIARHLSLVSDIVPSVTIDMLRDEIARIAAKSDGRLTIGAAVAFMIALWSANAGVKAIFDALNIIYGETEKRGFLQLNAISLFFTFCAIGAALLAIGAVVVFPLVLAALGLSILDRPFIGLLRWPLMFVLIIVGLSALYRYGPSRRRARWRWLSVGSVFAALAWLVVSSLFSWYLSNVANYNATYGALGAVVGLMMWMWLGTIVVLVGAVLNSEIEHQTAWDTTIGPPKPLGLRGAVRADTVGRAAD